MDRRTLKLIACAALALSNVAISQDVESLSPPQVEQERVAREAYRSRLDKTMRSEDRDPDWAASIEGQIHESLATVSELDFSVRNLKCAATLCRVVLDHQTLSGQEEVVGNTAGLPGFDLAGRAHSELSDDGLATTYIYLLRPDASWPEVSTR